VKQFATIVGVLVSSACVASATELKPGEIQLKEHSSVPGGVKYSTVLPPSLSSPNQLDELVSPMTGEFIGTVTSRVFQDPSTGNLGFAYLIELSEMSVAPLVRATMDGWAGTEILDTGSDASGDSGTFDPNPEWLDGDPYSIERDPFTEGLAIQFRQAVGSGQIGTVIGPGDTSAVMFFATNMPDYTTGEIDLIDTALTGEAVVLVPIPEPSSVILLALGAVAGLLRRR
jgi:hypothetical protein